MGPTWRPTKRLERGHLAWDTTDSSAMASSNILSIALGRFHGRGRSRLAVSHVAWGITANMYSDLSFVFREGSGKSHDLSEQRGCLLLQVTELKPGIAALFGSFRITLTCTFEVSSKMGPRRKGVERACR